ncbi:MAG: hypothetical protein KJO40_03830 [Deltaproteobacteria bacterium]|nr:hypothetical protein [Deltaproteobacteria bacterium]NND27238.1 hypothetical protein [Myxococcales bacterium]MBT8465189.1 hypothetical protein [Deltaproteobacteria bacterium]MBT8483029.1 hypothetical protein [Deltaproteobacteria bacterium]NNK08479.1 hypothetical protein [Myxococcales bacterium]
MKKLSFGFLLFLLSIAVGCGSDSSASGTAGAGGSAGSGGDGGAGGAAGMAGAGGEGGVGGMAGVGGMGGSGGTSGPPALLSEWGLFKSIPDQIPEDGLIPYEVTAALFTDDAAKFRFVQVPDGEQIVYSDTERWLNPAGTIYVKTFAYPVDATQPELGYQLIETRLLVFGEDKVDTWTYVYPEGSNDDAERVNFGPVLDVSWVNALGETILLDYEVPSVPQCKECHSVAGRSLGPSTGMFNRDNDYGDGIGVLNQIDYMNSLGMFDAEPLPVDERTTYVSAPAVDTEAGLHDRVRSYFDSNCAHCHAPAPYGEIADKGLYLDYQSMDPGTGTSFFTWGVCKPHTSGGNGVDCEQSLDVVPGDPDASFLLCRMESVAAGERMAPVGRTIVHAEGVELIREWIQELPNLFEGVTPGCPQQ